MMSLSVFSSSPTLANFKKLDKCCRNLDKSSLYADLDRGDGTCIYLVGNKCSIYETRPVLCRVDDSYEAFFKEKMSLEEYYILNYESCELLKNIK